MTEKKKKKDIILKRECAYEEKKTLIFQIISQLPLHKYSTTTQIFSHLPFSLFLKKKKKLSSNKIQNLNYALSPIKVLIQSLFRIKIPL